MNKKTLTLLLVVTHLLCILVGYGIARMRPAPEDGQMPTEMSAEPMTTEATEEIQTESIAEQEKGTVETVESTGTTEETRAEEELETAPVYTQPPATNPPSGGEDAGGEWTPHKDETERD